MLRCLNSVNKAMGVWEHRARITEERGGSATPFFRAENTLNWLPHLSTIMCRKSVLVAYQEWIRWCNAYWPHSPLASWFLWVWAMLIRYVLLLFFPRCANSNCQRWYVTNAPESNRDAVTGRVGHANSNCVLFARWMKKHGRMCKLLFTSNSWWQM